MEVIGDQEGQGVYQEIKMATVHVNLTGAEVDHQIIVVTRRIESVESLHLPIHTDEVTTDMAITTKKGHPGDTPEVAV